MASNNVLGDEENHLSGMASINGGTPRSAVLVFMLGTIVISTFENDTKMPDFIMSILIAIIVTILLLAQLFRCPEAISTHYLLLGRASRNYIHDKSHNLHGDTMPWCYFRCTSSQSSSWLYYCTNFLTCWLHHHSYCTRPK
ncbi:uncharacterized protein LOC107844922 [Capsicum annuum]|uniref:uncharacterized protein LOC107844922 n=1 Tax=Capsicum annuum TaxID=4072 RepID=UPI001FB1477C|nr:uncharacterized protein LOC107844922 [Capsicum annuum]